MFARSWQVVGACRAGQPAPGQFISGETAGDEPIAVVRGEDGALRAFFNVCRHHAAAVVTAAGRFRADCSVARITGGPTVSMARSRGRPTSPACATSIGRPTGSCRCRSACGRVGSSSRVDARCPARRFSRRRPRGPRRAASAFRRCGGSSAAATCSTATGRSSSTTTWTAATTCRTCTKGLDSVLDYGGYTIENGARFCLQSSPLVSDGAEAATGAVRTRRSGALLLDLPELHDQHATAARWIRTSSSRSASTAPRCCSTSTSPTCPRRRGPPQSREHRGRRSNPGRGRARSARSVQRGLRSRAYTSGRLSVRREAGEHLFHRLLHADLTARPTARSGSCDASGSPRAPRTFLAGPLNAAYVIFIAPML